MKFAVLVIEKNGEILKEPGLPKQPYALRFQSCRESAKRLEGGAIINGYFEVIIESRIAAIPDTPGKVLFHGERIEA